MSGCDIGATRVDAATVGMLPASSLSRITMFTGGLIV